MQSLGQLDGRSGLKNIYPKKSKPLTEQHYDLLIFIIWIVKF